MEQLDTQQPARKSKTGLILGCAGAFIVVGILSCGGVIYLISKGIKSAGEGISSIIEEEQQRAQFVNNWNPPPADLNSDLLFPAPVNGFALSDAETNEVSSYDRFGIDHAGYRRVYQSGAQQIEVFCYYGDDTQDLYRRVAQAVNSGDFNSRSQYGGPSVQRHWFKVSPPTQAGYLWTNSGWNFFFYSTDLDDFDEFAHDYLSQVEKAGKQSSTAPEQSSSPVKND